MMHPGCTDPLLMLILYLWIARARDSRSSQRARICTAVAVSTVHADEAAACGNDARQAVLLEPLPSGPNQGHQRVSPDGHGVRLGWRPALSRAVAP